jgi:hypothetical protein
LIKAEEKQLNEIMETNETLWGKLAQEKRELFYPKVLQLIQIMIIIQLIGHECLKMTRFGS